MPDSRGTVNSCNFFGYVAAIVGVLIVIGVMVFAMSRVPAVLRVSRG